MAEVGRERWLDWLVAAVLLGLFGVAVGGSRAAFTGSAFPLPWQPWWDGFLQNSGTEMLGAFLTFILLEVIRGRRERKAQEKVEERRTKATRALVRSYIQAQELARLRAAQTPEERQPILGSMIETRLLEGANLYGVILEEADLWRANLQGAKYLTVEQLRQADILEGAILPDGTMLPWRTAQERIDGLQETWREAFEAWCETVVTEAYGWIRPADLPPADPDDE
jgi:hypothetical protein